MYSVDVNDVLYPPIEPNSDGMLPVSDLHTIYWTRYGNPRGTPVVVLHGGPGGGSNPLYAQFFNPTFWDIFQFDQRGCGKSTPFAEIKENTSQDLVADIEKLRQHFSIDKWHVFGGSWGSTLSVLYAETHPDQVLSLTLRGIFLGRQQDIDWLYVKGTNELYPDQYEAFLNHIPKSERSDIVSAYSKRLNSTDEETRREAARVWTTWEMACCHLIPNEATTALGDDLKFAAAIAAIECHYFMNASFLKPNQILNDIHKIKCPVHIVHGRYDAVCSPRFGWELHRALPHSTIEFPLAGHSAAEPNIALALRKATDRLVKKLHIVAKL